MIIKNFFAYTYAILTTIIIISCNQETWNPEKIDFSFFPEIYMDKSGRANMPIDLKLMASSKDLKLIDLDVNFIGCKGAYILNSSNDTIKEGETFKIFQEGTWQNYKFFSKEEGEHDLIFSFKNNKGYRKELKHKIYIGEETEFLFKTTFANDKIHADRFKSNGLDIDYEIIPLKEFQSFELKFEVELEDINKEASLNEKKPGEWFEVTSNKGTFNLRSNALGKHKVTVVAKNKQGLVKLSIIEFYVAEAPKINHAIIGDVFATITSGSRDPIDGTDHIVRTFDFTYDIDIEGGKNSEIKDFSIKFFYVYHVIPGYMDYYRKVIDENNYHSIADFNNHRNLKNSDKVYPWNKAEVDIHNIDKKAIKWRKQISDGISIFRYYGDSSVANIIRREVKPEEENNSKYIGGYLVYEVRVTNSHGIESFIIELSKIWYIKLRSGFSR